MIYDLDGKLIEDPVAQAKAFLDEPVALTDLLSYYDAPFDRCSDYLHYDVARCAFRCADIADWLRWECSPRHVASLLKDIPGWRGPQRCRRFGVHGSWFIRNSEHEERDGQGLLGFQLKVPDDDEWEDLVGSVDDDDDWRDLV